ncbi:Calcium-binding EF-hand family protein [Tripterygium wilfordii]|uniref:Calcium-binding EF-hand family protein n=1 Tax=Tripterygium wilfordii TaxID=458696 RepID=A0A7J7CNB0_TRIWF|nr:probable calcium-binding protein CML44 isoform X2 [Tripterygium wilfordii]KAF5735478.1 Calcium-binding EF-hand family protein [Tripterygium wilfordii]
MCSVLNPDDLQRIFTILDKNSDGLVSLEELNCVLERIGMQFRVQELESTVGKTSLNWDEFLFFYESLCKRTEMVGEAAEAEEEDDGLVKAFKVFDLNGDGFISSHELQNVLTRLGFWDEKSGKDCRSMICEYDTNCDGVIDFEEFKNMMLGTNS